MVTVCLLPFHVMYLRKLTRNRYVVLCVLRTQSDTLLIEEIDNVLLGAWNFGQLFICHLKKPNVV
jgi:hypothetical protein